MIRSAAIYLLTAAVQLALTGQAFNINQSALVELKRIDGYSRFFSVHPELFINGALEGWKNYLLDNDAATLETSLDAFKEQVFLKPCREITELYNRYKEYFDELPTTVMDFGSPDFSDIDRNLLCRVFAIVKDCKLYTEHSFITRVHIVTLAAVYLDSEVSMID